MKKAGFLDYIDDMRDAISKIEKFLSDFDFETFSKMIKLNLLSLGLWKLLARPLKRYRII